jgi:mannosyltransferase
MVTTRSSPPRQRGGHRTGEPPTSQPVDASALPRLYLGLLAAITLVGLLLRLPSFNSSIAGDEISTYYIVAGHSLGRVLSLVYSRQETTPPLYFILAWATKGWLGNTVQSIRLVSLVTGIASIPLTFLLGLWTVGRRAALVAATCMACSPYMIYFSTEARTYMLVLFLALVSSICLLRALDTSRPLWWVGYAASTCAAAYSHYTAAFFLVAQLAWAFWTHPAARRALIISNAAAIVAYLPWIGGFRADLNSPNLIPPILAPFNFHTISRILEDFWIGHPTLSADVVPGNLAVTLAAVGLALGALGLVLNRRGKPAPWQVSSRMVLILVLAVVPAVIMVLYSWLRVDVLGGGNMIASWPAMALAIGALVTAPAKPLRLTAVTLTVGAFAIGGADMLKSSSQPGNINAAAAFIDRTGRTGPIVSVPFFQNPLTELDVALAGTPSYTYTPGDTEDKARPASRNDPHPVIRLDAPPLSEQLPHYAGPDPNPVFLGLPMTSPNVVARQAASLARNGTMFVVTYGLSPSLNIKVSTALSSKSSIRNSQLLRQFFEALPPRFHVVEHVTFPSNFASVSVWELRDASRGPQ